MISTVSLADALKSLINYADSMKSKEEEILKELGITLSAKDIVDLLQDSERLNVAVRKLKLKAFW